MDEVPKYLLHRRRRASFHEDATAAGEKSEDGDFKQLAKIREEYRNGTRKLSTITESDIQPVISKSSQPERGGYSTGNSTSTIAPALPEGKHDEQISQLFEAVLEDDATKLSQVAGNVGKSVIISDLVDHNNGLMNALNYAIEHGKSQSAKYLVSIADETMLLHQYYVQDIQTQRTALHQITISGDYTPAEAKFLAGAILEKVKDKKKALTLETKYNVKGQRERTFPCLHLAALLGKEVLVKLFLETGVTCGVSVDHKNSKNDTAILWASRSGHYSIVKYLLVNDADPNIGNDKASTALHWAVRYEQTSTVTILLNSPKTDVNKMRSLGLYTPLIMACAYGFVEIVKLLISKGADVNFRAPGGVVAIHIAAEEGHLDVLKILLRNKADFVAEDEKGDTAITIAARNGYTQIVLTLLNWMDDPYRQNHMGHNTWYYAINHENDQVIKVLLDFYNLKPTIEQDADGNVFQSKSPLFTAASMGKCDKIKYILDACVKADLTDLEGNTFMHYAAVNDQAEVIESYHKYCNINATNKRQETPLHKAVMLGKTNSIHALLRVKAKTNIKNASSQNVLHVAAKSANTTPEIARELVAYTIQAHSWSSVNDVDKNGNNALHIAAKYAKPEVLWEFRRISFKMQNKKGCTPFHRSVRKDVPEILETMLDIFEGMQRAGNINERNNKGETVLHLAVLAGFENTVKRLIYLRADLEIRDQYGDTPLHRLVKFLVEKDDAEHQRICLSTWDAIIYECPRWFCYSSTFRNEKFSFFSEDYKLIQRYRRQGLTWLLHKITNNDNLSVFTLCFSVGAHEVLSKLLTLEHVKYFGHEGFHYNDVTDITPLTNGSLAERYFSLNSNKVTPNICGLELLGSVNDNIRASKVLDIIPIRFLEKIYGRLNLITFSILIIIHLAYMFIFSFTGIEISKLFRNSTYNFSPSALMTVAVYVVIPVEPFVLIIFSIVTFCSAVRRRDYSKPLSSMFPFMFYLSYSFLVVSWIALVSLNERYQDYVLALCLCFGWLYTIVLTRGLKGIHYFWRMIKFMVIKDTFRFLVVYVCVLLAFSFSLHAVFQVSSSISDTYNSVADTVFLTFTIMLGMGEIFDDSFDQGMSAAGRTTVFAKLLFVVYVVLAAIILLNMLIAMMNESYQSVSEDQKISWRIDSIQLGVRTERLLPLSKHLFRSFGLDMMEIPGEEKGLRVNEKVVMKYFLKTPRGTARNLRISSSDVMHQKEKVLVHFKEQITHLNERLLTSQNEIQENRTRLDEMDQKLDLILKCVNKSGDEPKSKPN